MHQVSLCSSLFLFFPLISVPLSQCFFIIIVLSSEPDKEWLASHPCPISLTCDWTQSRKSRIFTPAVPQFHIHVDGLAWDDPLTSSTEFIIYLPPFQTLTFCYGPSLFNKTVSASFKAYYKFPVISTTDMGLYEISCPLFLVQTFGSLSICLSLAYCHFHCLFMSLSLICPGNSNLSWEQTPTFFN